MGAHIMARSGTRTAEGLSATTERAARSPNMSSTFFEAKCDSRAAVSSRGARPGPGGPRVGGERGAEWSKAVKEWSKAVKEWSKRGHRTGRRERGGVVKGGQRVVKGGQRVVKEGSWDSHQAALRQPSQDSRHKTVVRQRVRAGGSRPRGRRATQRHPAGCASAPSGTRRRTRGRAIRTRSRRASARGASRRAQPRATPADAASVS